MNKCAIQNKLSLCGRRGSKNEMKQTKVLVQGQEGFEKNVLLVDIELRTICYIVMNLFYLRYSCFGQGPFWPKHFLHFITFGKL